MTRDVAVLPLVPYPAEVAPAPDVRLSARPRIATGESTAGEAAILAQAITRRTGRTVDVAVGASPEPGDVELLLAGDGAPESYALSTADGVVRITAPAAAGVHWGAQTLRQLLTQDADGWTVRGATIADAPRFRYRGAMMDLARHFFTPAEVRAYVDRISAYKLNVLHLHLTDDQGWRIEVAGWPKLTERAASTSANGAPGGFLSAQDYADVVAYAAARHVTVVPEVDTPGHTHAVSVAYPQFAAASVLSDEMRTESARLGQELPVFGEPYEGWLVGFSSLRIGDDATTAFITDVFRRIAEMTPGPWLHLGGDECLGTDPEDYAAFVRTAASAVQAAGKTPIAWHEAGRVADLPRGTVGQYWDYVEPREGAAADAQAFVDGGGAVILSPSDAAYLDMKYDDGFHLGLAWADGPTSVERSYAWEPSAVLPALREEDVLGVEAPLWSETVGSLDDLDSLAFPKLPGIAEIAWSPKDAAARSWDSVRTRIAALAPAWQAEGVRFHASEEIPW